MKIKSIREIEPVQSNCISVDSSDKLFAIGESGNLMTHNSVAQQNIIISCLLRPKNWVILGIDLKRVELTRFKKFGVKVATDLETSVEFLRFAQAVMMKRYERMEELGFNDFEDLPEQLQALMVMIDEAGELLSPTGAKTDEAKEADELKGEAIMIIGSIARLGRASGVHLVVATQRPDAKLIPGEIRDNLAVRIGCGRMKPSASSMLFGSNIGQRIHASPRGGMYVQVHGRGNMGQGFFAPNDWLDKYYSENNLFDKIKPPELATSLNDTAKKSDKSFIEYWDADMEELYEDED
jgi:hypothetical protein